MTARKDFLQSLTLGKKSEPTAEYAPSLRSPWRASMVLVAIAMPRARQQPNSKLFCFHRFCFFNRRTLLLFNVF
ncbi:hypothetical protein [Candidiatus Paracoxiella cheracis]|uniref:hypothetical protein n=1 Tax=Candidiatus Paracoxiella cheracis TaxID=3405120 RepID=UPI003BF5B2AE